MRKYTGSNQLADKRVQVEKGIPRESSRKGERRRPRKGDSNRKSKRPKRYIVSRERVDNIIYSDTIKIFVYFFFRPRTYKEI